MLSRKRLFYVLLIVLSVCTLFVIYNINESNSKIVSISSNVVEEKELLYGGAINKSNELTFYVIGDEGKDLYKDIYQNVCQWLASIKVKWKLIDRVEQEHLSDPNAVLIFCDNILNPYVDLAALAEYVENGGKIVLAAGIADGYEDVFLSPVIGIVEKTIKEEYQHFRFTEGFFPLQEEIMSFDGYNSSTWVSLRDEANVYVETVDKGVPIIYTHPFGEGMTLVINGTLLSDSASVGFLAAGIGCLLEDFVYPVMGTECVFLDNFPIVTYVSDPACMRLYGRTTESFVRDVVWPVFQGIAVRNDIEYTSSVLAVASDEDVFPMISESLFNTLGKSALQFNGEMAYAVYCEDDTTMYRNEEFISSFDKTFHNYMMQSMVMVGENSISASIETLGKDITAVRGKLFAKKEENRLYISDEYCVFPEATSGIELEDGCMLDIASVFASYGMVSHTFDINSLITVDENQPNWDLNKKQLSEFEERVFSQMGCLEKVTLSETRNIVNSYLSMEYTWEKRENELVIEANGIVEGQPFMIRTHEKVMNVEGAEVMELDNNYYMIRMSSTRAVLTME